MCLLTFMSAGTTASEEDLCVGALNNPDGFGFAIHAGTRIIHRSGLVFERIYDEFLKERSRHQGPALFHSRITTHGGTSLDNCHPFQVGRDSNTVVAHNGMLPIPSTNGRSDTRIFAEELFPSWGGVRTLDSRKMRKKLSKYATGSKLVFLTADRHATQDYYIINEKDGHWVNGIWWSNSSYKWAPTYRNVGGGMYTSGWQKTNDIYTHDDSLYYGGLVEDCTYVDQEGNEVWGELWTCGLCQHMEYFDEDNIDEALLCPNCNSCWYCANDRFNCKCYVSDDETTHDDTYDNRKLLSVGSHDSLVDIDEINY